jgi:hypothetical protein
MRTRERINLNTILDKHMKIRKECSIINFVNLQTSNINLSIITLNINCLNSPIERFKVTEWILKQYLFVTYKKLTLWAKTFRE